MNDWLCKVKKSLVGSERSFGRGTMRWMWMENSWMYINNGFRAKPNIFLRICTHTQTIPISSDLCPPMPTHIMTCVHPCPPMPTHATQIAPMCSKIVLCVLPAYTKFWLDQTNKKSFIVLALAHSASWLAYFLHPRSLTPI